MDIDGLEDWELSTPTSHLKQQADLFTIGANKVTGAPMLVPNTKQQVQVNNQSYFLQGRSSWDVTRAQGNAIQRQYEFDKEMAKRSGADPVSYGAPGMGTGLARDPLIQTSAMMVAPATSLAVGGLFTYQGIKTGDYTTAATGGLMMLGGTTGLYAKFAPGAAGAQLAEMEAVSGGHFLSRHGAQTSLSSQYLRAISGMTPEGVVLGEVNASRFFSNEIQLEAARMAQAQFANTGKSVITLDMGKLIGEGFLKGGGAGSYRTTTQVQAFFKEGQLNTLFPLIKK